MPAGAMAAEAATTNPSAGMYEKRLPSSIFGSLTFSRGATRSTSLAVTTRTPLRKLLVVCHSEPAGGCCGGSGNSSGSGSSCSSHDKGSLANLGKEFEHLVAKNSLIESEEDYVSGPMEGNITRDVMNSVMELDPDDEDFESERCLDINEVLRDAKNMSNGDLVFSENSDFVIV